MQTGLRWVALVALFGCDSSPPGKGLNSDFRSMGAVEMAPPVVCSPSLASTSIDGEVTIDWPDASGLWIRNVDFVVPISSTLSAAVGRYGDFYAEGLFVLAFEEDGGTAWALELPMYEGFRLARVEPLADGMWTVGGEPQRTAVWRHASDGTEQVAVVVEDLIMSEINPTPDDGLLVIGVDGRQQPAFAEVSANGEVLWQGPEVLTEVDWVVADGVVRRFGAGTELWEYDPRPDPFPGFAEDRGTRWATLLPSEAVLAFGTVVGEGGNTSILFELQSDGTPGWSQTRPYVTVERARALPGGRMFAAGSSWECSVANYFAVLSDEGEPILEGRSQSPVVGVDAHQRLLAWSDVVNGIITLQSLGEVPQ